MKIASSRSPLLAPSYSMYWSGSFVPHLDRGEASQPPPSHTTGHMGHVSGGSAAVIGVRRTSQPVRHLPARQPRVHPRGRTAPDPSPEVIAPLHTWSRFSFHRSDLQHAPAGLRCPLLTSTGPAGRIAPLSVSVIWPPSSLKVARVTTVWDLSPTEHWANAADLCESTATLAVSPAVPRDRYTVRKGL
jgi:hypothetical protein